MICVSADSVQEEEEEEIIRCICGIYRDEGLMIQCEKCFVSIIVNIEEIIRCICGIYRDKGLVIQCEKCFVCIVSIIEEIIRALYLHHGLYLMVQRYLCFV